MQPAPEIQAMKSVGGSGKEWGQTAGQGAIHWVSVKMTGTMLTLLSFCQLSMTCIILDACFPGSGDRQSDQSHFTASLTFKCSTQPPLHLTICLSCHRTLIIIWLVKALWKDQLFYFSLYSRCHLQFLDPHLLYERDIMCLWSLSEIHQAVQGDEGLGFFIPLCALCALCNKT